MAAAPPLAPVVDIPLSLFSGWDPELNAADCPEGISPDNQDMVYLPGSADSRPGLHKLFTAFPLSPTIAYQKTYVQPNGVPLNIILDSKGFFRVENVLTGPGSATVLFQTSPGLYAQSVSAFGREYIALSDLLHGAGVPLQYDGTFLDRVSQDGPGAGPSLSNFSPPSATLANGAPTAINIAASPGGVVWGGLTTRYVQKTGDTISNYTFFTVTTTANHGFSVGQQVTLAGTANVFPAVNGVVTISSVPSSTTFTVNRIANADTATNGGGGTATALGAALTRANNVVTALTAAAHDFQVGWQVQIQGVANSNLSSISSISRDGTGTVTVTTTSAHGLAVGAQVAIVGVTNPDASFNGTFQVAAVLSTTQFTYLQSGTVESSGAGTGNVQDIWTGSFYILSILSPTSFTYAQVGANDSTSNTGTAAIQGQVAAGTRSCVVMFLTRQGYLTKPSPPVQFATNGGQMIGLSNIPLGPSNVVARYLAFTGANGGNYFTIPALPQIAGTVVGSSLVIPDNTTTSAVLDFSDNTLFAGIAIDQAGNNLFDQVVLGPVAGFFAYNARLFPWGEYNKLQNFVNMGMCGGYLAGVLTTPLGWNSANNSGGTLVNGGPWASAMAWQITGDGSGSAKGQLSQSAYQDYQNNAIMQPRLQYSLRVWLQVSVATVGNFTATFTSNKTGFIATASVSLASVGTIGAFVPLVNISAAMPAQIPNDLTFTISAQGLPNGVTLLVAELEIIPVVKPYLDNIERASYVNNPEAFAATTGILGANDDASPIRCHSLQKNAVLLKSAEGTHTFQSNDYEPYQWTVSQISRSVGSVSLRGGDPGRFGTGDAAEDWDVSFTKNGLYLFAGGDFWKVSQEMQPQIDSINWAAQQTIWVKNDVGKRRVYIAVPTGTAVSPNLIFVMDYRELDTALQIANSPPVHISFTGKMICSDLTRKWSRWNISANSGEILVRPNNDRQMSFGAGNGLALGQGSGFGNVYYLDPAKLTDDDYGQIFPYYTTYGFVNHEQEQGLGLGSGRKLMKKVCAFVTGTGLVSFTPLVDSLQNALPASSTRQLVTNTSAGTAQTQDFEWTTGIRGERIFLKFSVAPLQGTTDVKMSLQKLIVSMTPDPIAIRRSSRL